MLYYFFKLTLGLNYKSKFFFVFFVFYNFVVLTQNRNGRVQLKHKPEYLTDIIFHLIFLIVYNSHGLDTIESNCLNLDSISMHYINVSL